MTDAYAPLMDQQNGRIVNMGSGAGPMYFKIWTQDEDVKNFLKSDENTWEDLETFMDEQIPKQADEGFQPYCLSKALLHNYNIIAAKQYPNLTISAVNPGFTDTALTAGIDNQGPKQTPEEGTATTRHCLFEDLGGSGWYFGTDSKRSPIHETRDPGSPEYDPDAEGIMPFGMRVYYADKITEK